MALPLPAPPGPGGDFLAALNANRQAEAQQLQNQLLRMQNQYAPLTIPAEAASKLAYANLMGPQFLAKLLGNQDILANIPNAQGAINSVFNAASGQMPGNAFLNMPMGRPQSPIGQLVDNIRSAFGFGGLNQNPMQNISQQMPANNALMRPQQQVFDESSYNRPPTPREQRLQDFARLGDVNGISAGTAANPSNPLTAPVSNLSTAEQSGRFAGIKAEGQQAGKHRADEIKSLGDKYEQAVEMGDSIDRFSNLLSDPRLERLRQSGILGHYELGYFGRYGTPEEKQLIGKLRSEMVNFVTNYSQKFKGAFRRGEQALLENGKPNDNDTIDVMRGKIQSMGEMNEFIKQRSRLTAEIMRNQHIDKDQAIQLADQQLDGNAIRNQVSSQLNAKPTDEDIRFMASKYNISEDEVRRRLKAKGIG